MNDSLWTFVFQTANFVVLAALLAWLFFEPVRRALESQQAKGRRLEEDAERKLADAESHWQEVESQRRALASELEAMRDKVREKAKQEAEQILAEARARADQEQAALKRDALHIERAQLTKIARAVAGATHDAMQRLLRQMQGPELEQALLRTACREVQTLSNNSLAPVTVESAAPLDDEGQRLIRSSLRAAAKSVSFRVAPELDAGLRISTAHGLIDASAAGLAQFAEQSLAAEMEAIIREEQESE